jgi:hypothetical protein
MMREGRAEKAIWVPDASVIVKGKSRNSRLVSGEGASDRGGFSNPASELRSGLSAAGRQAKSARRQINAARG